MVNGVLFGPIAYPSAVFPLEVDLRALGRNFVVNIGGKVVLVKCGP